MEYTVLSNKPLSEGFYLMETDCSRGGQPGQFYMIRAWGGCPVLSRPLSVFDAEAGKTGFLYRTVGRGTGLFARLKPGDAIGLIGPQGRGFPDVKGKTALVGGGAGIAPLYLAARRIKDSGARADVFLGFRGEPFLTEAYKALADRLVVNSGGFITDDIDPTQYDAVFTCGPEIMMKVLYEKCKKTGQHGKVYVSLESRMACGVGACYVCTRPIGGGNKKICKDGPVFPAEEVYETDA